MTVLSVVSLWAAKKYRVFGTSVTKFHRITFSKSGEGQIAKLLIDGKADVNIRDQDGLTPLHMVPKQPFPLRYGFQGKLVASGASYSMKIDRYRMVIEIR